MTLHDAQGHTSSDNLPLAIDQCNEVCLHKMRILCRIVHCNDCNIWPLSNGMKAAMILPGYQTSDSASNCALLVALVSHSSNFHLACGASVALG